MRNNKGESGIIISIDIMASLIIPAIRWQIPVITYRINLFDFYRVEPCFIWLC